MSSFARLILATLILAMAIGIGCDSAEERNADQRVIIIQGVCSSSVQFTDDSSWTQNVKRDLEAKFGFEDLTTGDPDDQVIEFSYSPEQAWSAEYEASDTLRPIAESSAKLLDIYDAYPDSDFFIVAHSLGGIVALNALANSIAENDDLHVRTLGLATVSSPVRGITQDAANLAAFTIELLACRDVSGVTSLGEVWDDLLTEGDSIQRIHSANWESMRVINFANRRDRVTDWETAHLTPPFDSHCFDLRDGIISLNHDIALRDSDSLGVILGALIDGDQIDATCSE